MDTVGDAIAGLRFQRRPESWVAVAAGRFYKIARKGNDSLEDFMDPACAAMAADEHGMATFLAGLAPAVLAPIAIERACIVYPAISGPDMRDLLAGRASDNEAEAALEAAMELLAALHSDVPDAASLEPYGEDGWFMPPPADLLPLLGTRATVLVVDGFEVRNFRFDAGRKSWRFFDPHRIRRGCPECDVARFMVSLLMIPWGRSARFLIWTRFAPTRLLHRYRAAGGPPVDPVLLRYFFRENMAMRRHHAERAIAAMRWPGRWLARAYAAAFFFQMKRWVRSNGF